LLRTDGPRAGINCPPPPASLDPTFVSLTVLTGTHCRAGNDGFAGGSTVEGNLVFNMVRETGDHGPYNSWDRQPYLTHSGHRDGYPDSVKHGTSGASILKQHDLITKNVFINGYNGVWTIDHDDGSQYFNDTQNFMVFGEDSNGPQPTLASDPDRCCHQAAARTSWATTSPATTTSSFTPGSPRAPRAADAARRTTTRSSLINVRVAAVELPCAPAV